METMKKQLGIYSYMPFSICRSCLLYTSTTDDGRPVFPLPVRDVLWYEVHGMGVALGMRENLSYLSLIHI